MSSNIIPASESDILLTLFVDKASRDICLQRLEYAVRDRKNVRIVVVDVSLFPNVAKEEELIMVPTVKRIESNGNGSSHHSFMVGMLSDRKAILEFVNWGSNEVVFSGFSFVD